MHIEFMRDSSKNMGSIATPENVTSMKIWHCKYSSLAPIAKCFNLETLVIATYPDDSLHLLEQLTSLRYLSILHLPKIRDLSPLKTLKKLESLSLSTLPSWDSSGKVTIVESLEPIASLSALLHLELFGVLPEDKTLRSLYASSSLTSARFAKYPQKEMSAYYEATGVSNDHIPDPTISG